MLNEKEITITELSATKKDFYQIWNELLDTAKKLSERWDPTSWDPTSTNESDPGIVLLKVLSGVADKLNYQIDTNTLEAYMPSAAQLESIRKLTSMMGYNMKYYESATTSIKITYNKKEAAPISGEVLIEKYTNIKDEEDSINYITLEDVRLTADNNTKSVDVMEGEIVECNTDDDNIISILQLDDHHRYYLPESQIAENGIFVTNIDNNYENDLWERVDNLNIYTVGKHIYKFGYDSLKGLPYIQFPDDISNIIEDGLVIKYVRTNGANGNISMNTLSKLTTPVSWSAISAESSSAEYYQASNYTVSQNAAATNGKNLETINEAYESYKKTIGTFDTLVTCRDYMNKIYQLTADDANTTPLVSNVIVSDIRDDINKAVTLCTFNEYGICYKNMARPIALNAEADGHPIAWFSTEAGTPSKDKFNKIYKVLAAEGSSVIIGYKKCIYNENKYIWIDLDEHEIDHFDLVLYPFKTVNGLNSYLEYTKSFKYDDTNVAEILSDIEETKTLSHNVLAPNIDDIVCIKNYLQLKAKITTVRKVNISEQLAILNNIYKAIYENFNLRKLDFGSSLMRSTIKSVIENADSRIKDVPLEEPVLYTKFCLANGTEYDVDKVISSTDTNNPGALYYNKLALNNILAGRIPMFNYNEDFKYNFTEAAYPAWSEGETSKSYNPTYPTDAEVTANNGIYSLEPKFTISGSSASQPVKDIKLKANEVIQFRAPYLQTTDTFGAYVNYFLKLGSKSESYIKLPAPATMQTLKDFLNGINDKTTEGAYQEKWTDCANSSTAIMAQIATTVTTYNTQAAYDAAKAQYIQLFVLGQDNKYALSTNWTSGVNYYHLEVNENTYNYINSYIKTCDAKYYKEGTSVYAKLFGLYKVASISTAYSIGYCIDNAGKKFIDSDKWVSFTKPYENLYVQLTHSDNKIESTQTINNYTKDGLGQDAESTYIKANEEYRLQDNDYLYISYTSSSTNTDGTSNSSVITTLYDNHEVIKPNFDLYDSDTIHKKQNFDKNSDTITNYTWPKGKPDGLFTLGASEQIELREISKVVLDDQISSIYWERNDEDMLTDSNGKIVFKFDENNNTSYTLKDGEYFYYSTGDRLSFNYYGSGTQIVKGTQTPEIYKYKTDASVTAEEIATYGLTASIPWRTFNLSTTNAALNVIENQYINLTENDTLNSFDDATYISKTLNGSWQNVNSPNLTNYTFADGTKTTLPILNLGDDAKWQVRTKLNLNVGPAKTQLLYRTDIVQEEIKVNNKNGQLVLLTPRVKPNNSAEYTSLAFRTNTLIQSSSDLIDATYKQYDASGQQIGETETPLRIKVFKEEELRNAEGTKISTNNFGDGSYTKLSFSDMKDQTSGAYITLAVTIPTNNFGLLLMQYNEKDSSGTNNAYIKFSEDTPIIFNYANDARNCDSSTKWWIGLTSGTKFYLRPGTNIIQINKSTNIEIYPDANKNSSVILGQLDIIYKDTAESTGFGSTSINPKLNYKAINSSTLAHAQLLKDIAAIDTDHDFYYNMLLDINSLIDINTVDDTDTLASPTNWYDYNNINNKFVVSEIDADYMINSGIVISKNSQL